MNFLIDSVALGAGAYAGRVNGAYGEFPLCFTSNQQKNLVLFAKNQLCVKTSHHSCLSGALGAGPDSTGGKYGEPLLHDLALLSQRQSDFWPMWLF